MGSNPIFRSIFLGTYRPLEHRQGSFLCPCCTRFCTNSSRKRCWRGLRLLSHCQILLEAQGCGRLKARGDVDGIITEVSVLIAFGAIAVSIMFLSYWLERRSKWMVLLFALGSALTSAYSGLVTAYPITVIEAPWTLVALRRFMIRHREEGDLARRQAMA